MTATEPINAAESLTLQKIIRQRAKVARSSLDARIADLLADFEQQMATQYDEQDEMIKDLWKEARAFVKAKDDELAERADTAGIPANMRPSLAFGLIARGENSTPGRRAELRRVAVTRLDSMKKSAKLKIDAAEAESLGTVLVASISSTQAQELIAGLPTAEQLMVPLQLAWIERENEKETTRPRSIYGY